MQGRADKATEPGMVWIPGGTFRMGSDMHYAEEAPVHRVTVDAFLDRSHSGYQPRSSANSSGRPAMSPLPRSRRDPKDYPGALPHMLRAGSLVFNPPTHAGRHARLEPMVDAQIRRRLAPALWTAQFDQQDRRPSRGSRRLPGRPRLRRDGPARICRPKRSGSSPARGGLDGAEFAWGRRVHARRQADGKHLAGRVPTARI